MVSEQVIRYERPPLYPAQEAAIFAPERYAVIEASTKSGKTYACIAWLFEQAILAERPGRQFWWVAPSVGQARIAFDRLVRGLPRGMAQTSESALTLRLPNGSVIAFRTGENADALYGEDVHAAVVDEATRLKPAAWHAVRSTLTATRGPVRIIGNVNGTRNWAYALARQAEAGHAEMHYARITAYDAVEAGVLARAEVEDARARLSEAVFRELYLAEPAASLSLIYAPFGPENVSTAAAYVRDAGPLWVGYDWGFTEPTHIGLYQYRDGVLYQFDELVGSGRSEQTWVETVLGRVEALSGYDGPSLERWRGIWAGTTPWPEPWPQVWPELAAGDPSAVQLRSEFKRRGVGAVSPRRVRHAVESGQDVLRSLILSGAATRRLIVHPRCAATIEAFRNYRAHEIAEGVYGSRPDPDASNHRYSHGTDQARYLVWTMRRHFGLAGARTEGEAE